jgi:hypothetical protein
LAIIAEHSFFVKQQDNQIDFQRSIDLATQQFLDSVQLTELSHAIGTMWSNMDFGQKPGGTQKNKVKEDLKAEMMQVVLDFGITYGPEGETA